MEPLKKGKKQLDLIMFIKYFFYKTCSWLYFRICWIEKLVIYTLI